MNDFLTLLKKSNVKQQEQSFRDVMTLSSVIILKENAMLEENYENVFSWNTIECNIQHFQIF